jgi:hypothetical protein
MAYSPSLGFWTTLPPKQARRVLLSMQRAALIGLIQVLAVVVAFPNLAAIVAYA